MKILDRLITAALPMTPRPLVRVIANRYVAGEDVESAVATVVELNRRNVLGTIDALGEFVKSVEGTRFETDRCLHAVEQIRAGDVRSGLSVKLTSLGLEFDKALCRENLVEILRLAEEKRVFVRIDMENSPYTESTLELAMEMWEKFPGRVGVVLQAYLRRTLADVERLAPSGISFRLCKGIYNEPEEIAYKGREEVQVNFLAALRLMLEHNAYVGIATHDDLLIEGAVNMVREYGLNPSEYEFQMLLGVREARRSELVTDGHRMRVYVPFGVDWYGYSMRRISENPAIAGHVFKALFRKGG